MYRRTGKYQSQVSQMAAARLAKERGRLERAVPAQRIDLPDLRRVIEITDYDTGEPVVHRFELYRSDRLDCYNVLVDGQLWKKRIGWSRVLEGVRKAMLRLCQLE